jgi:DNA repair protein RadC
MTGARQALVARILKGTVFSSPKVTADYLIDRLGQLQFEAFTLICLDSRHRFIACQDLFRCAIDGASVHPREVVKEAPRHDTAAVILSHVHPSGVAEPSAADEATTRRLRDAPGLVDINVLDHVIAAARAHQTRA